MTIVDIELKNITDYRQSKWCLDAMNEYLNGPMEPPDISSYINLPGEQFNNVILVD